MVIFRALSVVCKYKKLPGAFYGRKCVVTKPLPMTAQRATKGQLSNLSVCLFIASWALRL